MKVAIEAATRTVIGVFSVSCSELAISAMFIPFLIPENTRFEYHTCLFSSALLGDDYGKLFTLLGILKASPVFILISLKHTTQHFVKVFRIPPQSPSPLSRCLALRILESVLIPE